MAHFAIRQVQRLAGRRAASSSSPTSSCRTRRTCSPRAAVACSRTRRSRKSEAELFEQQLHYTNERMKRIVDSLLDGPDETDPIIVISGDEGPYLCGDVDCVDGTPETYGIRLGVLRAYYLPGLDYAVPADDTGVNIFRMHPPRVLRRRPARTCPTAPTAGRTRTTSTTSGTSPTTCRCRAARERGRLRGYKTRTGASPEPDREPARPAAARASRGRPTGPSGRPVQPRPARAGPSRLSRRQGQPERVAIAASESPPPRPRPPLSRASASGAAPRCR